jgi:hypothetical protein
MPTRASLSQQRGRFVARCQDISNSLKAIRRMYMTLSNVGHKRVNQTSE